MYELLRPGLAMTSTTTELSQDAGVFEPPEMRTAASFRDLYRDRRAQGSVPGHQFWNQGSAAYVRSNT